METIPNTDSTIQAFVVFFDSEGEPADSAFMPIIGWKLNDCDEAEELAGLPESWPVLPGAFGGSALYCLAKGDVFWSSGGSYWTAFDPKDAHDKLVETFNKRKTVRARLGIAG